MARREEVLLFLKAIPRGKVTTYKALAEKFATHPRGIASILRTNTMTVAFPCYKVVAHDGGVSGYILGVEKKIALLEDDGVTFHNQKVDEQHIIRHFS